jgi:membrane protein YdbS with pleckstrin-like domain
MAYPKHLLNPGEEIAVDFNPHWWYFWEVAAAGLGTIVLAFLFLRPDGTIGDILQYAWYLIAIAWLGATVWRWLTWRTTHFVVTSDRLIFRAGVFSRTGREIPLERINDITFNQTLFERMLGAGDLVIESAGTQGQQKFSDIPNPEFVQAEIYRQIEGNSKKTAEYGKIDPTAIAQAMQATQAPPPPAPTYAAPSTESVTDQLAKLAELRDKGVITQADFEAKKAELLGRI